MTVTDKYYALLKIAASYGDYVNAGLGAMTFGSPSTPRYFKPGTNEISDDLPKQQKNTVVGNGIGLGAVALPSVAGGALTVARAAPAAWSVAKPIVSTVAEPLLFDLPLIVGGTAAGEVISKKIVQNRRRANAKRMDDGDRMLDSSFITNMLNLNDVLKW